MSPSEIRHPFRLMLMGARGLFPGYFAFVMATGIVSIACDLLHLRWIAMPLFAISWTGYAVLWAFTLARLVRYPARLVLDLFNHQRAPGFFTIVASTCVLGTQTAVLTDAPAVAAGLWYLGLGLWALVMYSFLTAVTIRSRKPPLARGINGAWLIGAVATQSIVVLQAALGTPPPAIQFLCLAFFLLGGMLYIAIIPLIFYRLTFVRFASTDFGPPYWINMGAAAITALAGASLLARGAEWPVLEPFLPTLAGLTVFFWAAASWWIPLLIALMVWRYVRKRDPLRYDPQLWGMVFPLGMYTTATLQMARALDLPFLAPVAEGFLCLALVAWLATFTGLVADLARSTRAPQRPVSSRRITPG